MITGGFIIRCRWLGTALLIGMVGVVFLHGAGRDGSGQEVPDARRQRPPAAERPTEREAGDRLRLPPSVTREAGIEYAKFGERSLRLEVLRPTALSETRLAAIVFIHGGGWRNGDASRNLPRLVRFAESGDYVCFSIGYRLSGEAAWPAQIHDCKAAVRFIRANADRFRIDPERIGVMGSSAGGHLVAMLGTCREPDLEGTLGVTGVSSEVRCVAALCPTTDLADWGAEPNAGARQSIEQLLGAAWGKAPARAAAASPINYVSADDPPFLVSHSRGDPSVPFVQASRFAQALQSSGVEVTLVPVEGNLHGVTLVTVARERIDAFFARHLLGAETTVSAEPITPRNGE